MTVQQHFLDTLQELRERLAVNDRYALIKASALLRLLLLDEEPLIHQVNREHRLKLEFETSDFTMKMPVVRGKVHMWWATLDVANWPEARRIRVNSNKFLGAHVLTYASVEYSVKDVILAAAHLKGGVHHGKANDPAEQKLLDFDEMWKLNGVETSVHALRGIIAVTLHGLSPLETAVRGSMANSVASG